MLIRGTLYTVNLATGSFTNDNNEQSAAASFSFTTAEIGIVSSTPANGDIGVPFDTTISITFNESLTRSDGEISLVNGSTSTPIATDESQITYQNGNSNVIITLPALLMPNTLYTVSLATGSFTNEENKQNAANSFSFMTVDTIEILSFTPANDATEVAFNTTISINFDGSVTRSDGEISLVNGSTSTPIATDESQITYQNGNSNVIITLPAFLMPNTLYTVNLAIGSFTNEENGISIDDSFSFTTLDTQSLTDILTTAENNFFEVVSNDGSFDTPLRIRLRDTNFVKITDSFSPPAANVFGTDLGNRTADNTVPVGIASLPAGLMVNLTLETVADSDAIDIVVTLNGNSDSHVRQTDNTTFTLSFDPALFTTADANLYTVEAVSFDYDITFAGASAPWLARSGHSVIVYNNELFLLGGQLSTSATNDIWKSSDGTNWVLVSATALWSPRSLLDTIVANNKLLVLGGLDSAFTDDVDNVWQTIDGITWMKIGVNVGWGERVNFKTVISNDTLWLLGGDFLSSVSRSNDVWRSTNGGTNWEQVTNSAQWSKRTRHQALFYNNQLWVLGGLNVSSVNGNNEIWVSSDQGTNWTQKNATEHWSGRNEHQAVVFQNKIWVIGGSSANSPLSDVWSSSDGENWTQETSSASWSKRRSYQVVVFNNRLYLIGGRNGNTFLNDTWVSSDGVTWEKIPEVTY